MNIKRCKIPLLTLTVLIVLSASLPAKAFSSGSPFFTFGWHGRITEEALSELGFSDKVVRQLKRGNRNQDWDVTPVRILNSKRHFCRDRNQSHEEGYARNKAYLEEERSRVIGLLSNESPRYYKARRILGWCLHTTQDAFSHSNYWEMSKADKIQFIKGITCPDEKVPDGTLFVCSGSDKKDSYAYGHDDHHKDSENSPEGEEAFLTAKEGAVEGTKAFVEETRRILKDALPRERFEEV